MRRRDFINLLAGTAAGWPLAGRAQQAMKILRVGLASAQPSPRNAPFHMAFANRMAELGYQEGGLVIVNDVFLITREKQLADLALRHKLPTIFQTREPIVAGGLLTYAGSASDAYRQAGVYTGRVLKGETPSDLPVQQATKVDLIINLKTAKALGLTIPPTLLARADEVIE